ncbi:SurA N-terminal domain-containing protein [Bacillus altitudinis]|uniref:SurA N-terminal domain-containing protein n=1 Tax=Bacillus altitudinis TaxID=293387 RepID=UPI002ACDECF4|nr:SurA N-terminal domain-containing protein [Bacillus altitudinis]WQH39191.1 SurA N-terminal domain-containing protein [Bacillus altitudinis]
MKKVSYTLIACLLSVGLAACSSNDAKQDKQNDSANSKETTQADQKEQQKQMEEMQKKLDAQKIDDQKVVATVNKDKITGSEYNSALSTIQGQLQQSGQDPTSKEGAKAVKKQTIDALVGQELILQDAEKKGYKASDKQVDKQLKEEKKQFKDNAQFEEALKKSGLTMDQLKSDIADSIKYSQYVDKEIKSASVSEKDVKAYYDQYAEQMKKQKAPDFKDVKSQIKKQLESQEKQKEVQKEIDQLKKSAKIDVSI